MKAIRGDNPRTTNQRVYLMPVVPPPPPEKPPTPDVEQFSLSFPPVPLSLYIGASLLSICLSARPPLVPFPLVLSAYRASSTLHPSPSLLCCEPLRSRSRVITLLLSDMSLCYRHNQPRAPPSLSLLLFSRVRSLVGPPSSPRFPAALFATCRTPAHPRDLAQSVLLY